MKPVGQIFDELPRNYENLMQRVESLPGSIVYAPVDFFNPEPFYYLMNSVQEALCNFYPEPEDLPEGSDVFVCLLADSKLRFVRESFSESVYYDSFFEYSEGSNTRNAVYVNGDDVKPISVDRLMENEEGLPVLFESRSQYGYQRVEYAPGDDAITAKRYAGLNADNMELISELTFQISPEGGEVEKILEKPMGHEDRVIYDKSFKVRSPEQLLMQARDLIVATVVESLQTQSDIENEISFILLEYSRQFPFPPTVALAQTKEVDAASREKDFSPLTVYNAPDLEYFSESDNPAADFYTAGDSLFRELNARLLAGEFEEYQKQTFDVYLEICKALKEEVVSRKLLPVADGFHVTARDYETCNEWEYLEELLPPERRQDMEKAMEEHREASGLPPEYRQLAEDMRSELETEQKTALKLKQDLSLEDSAVYYSFDTMHHLKPYEVEVREGRPNEDRRLLSDPQFLEKPDTPTYHQYYFSGERILARHYLFEGDVAEESYFSYDGEKITEYIIDSSGGLVRINRLESKNNLPLFYREVSETPELLEMRFEQEEGRIASYLEHDLTIHDPVKLERYFIYKFEYASGGQLYKISSFYAGKSSSTLTPYDDFEATVRYATDDSHIDRTFELVTEMALRAISDAIAERDLKGCIAAVLVRNNEVPFPLFRIYLLTREKGKILWDDVDVYDRKDGDSLLYRNTMLYTPRFGDKTLEDYQEEAFRKLAEMLRRHIRKEKQVDLQVLYKTDYDSPELINDKLEKV